MSFTNRFGKGLLASLESEEVVVAETVDPVEAENADNVEAALAEVVEAEAGVADDVEAIENGIDDADTLEEIADTLEETEQEGGADPVTAQVAEVAVEAIYRRLGVQRSPIQSMEAFGDKATRVQATRYSVEGIREVWAKIWEAISSLYTKIIESIKKFWEFVTNASVRAMARAKQLQEVAKKATGTPSAEQIGGGFVRTLVSGKTLSKADAMKNVAGLAKVGEGLKSVATLAKSGLQAADLEKLVNDPSFFNDYKASFTGFEITSEGEAAKKLLGLTDDADTAWFEVAGTATGGKRVLVRLPKGELTGEALFTALRKAQVRIAPVSKDQPANDAKVEPLTKDEAIQVTKDVIKAMEALKAASSTVDELVKVSKAVADKAKQLGGKEADEGQKKRAQFISGAAKMNATVPASVISSVSKISVEIARGGLDYVQKSLAQFPGSKAEAKAAGDAAAAAAAAAKA